MATRAIDLRKIEDEPMNLAPVDVVRELCDIHGRKTVAYLAGLNSVREVSSWLGGSAMQPDRMAILRSALQATRYISELESPMSAVAWFVGTNPRFDFESPATVLRERGMEGRADVVRAARAFVAEALAAVERAPIPA